MRIAKYIFILAIALATMAPPVFADGGGVDCYAPENVGIRNEVKQRYADMQAHDKAGRTRKAYDAASRIDPYCINKDKQAMERIEAEIMAVLKRTGLKLGDAAEKEGNFTEAYKYYEKNFHGIPADRVQMKLATSKLEDIETVRTGLNYFRNQEEYLKLLDANQANIDARHGFSGSDIAWAKDPNRDGRRKAITGYVGKLKDLATKNGEKFLADEEQVFTARKTSITAKHDSLDELKNARTWLALAGQENRANDRAVKRGDTLLADDSRKSLRLALSYYSFPYGDNNEKWAQKVRDKARRLGDAHLKKGEKKIAADYYNLAGLGDKASELEEANDAEEEQAESKRQEQFKDDQKSLEKELGL